MAINSTHTLSFRPMSDVAYHPSGRRSSRRGGGRRDFVAGDIVEVTKPFGRTVKLIRKVKNLRSGSTMNRWLVSFGHGLGSGAFDRRELPDMEMDEDCFRKLVSSEVFAPKSAQMRRSTSDEQKASSAVATMAAIEKSSIGKAVEDSLTQEAKVEEKVAVAAEPAAETAAAASAPPQQQNLQLGDDSAESSPRIENANDSNGASHKRKVSHGSSTSSPLDNSDQQPPPAKKMCPALKSEEPPTKPDAMDEERMDASTSERDEQQLQPPAEEPAPLPAAPAPPVPSPPIKEEEVVQPKVEVETKVELEAPVEQAPVEQQPELGGGTDKVVMDLERAPDLKMDVERTPDLKSVHSEEAKETEDNGDGEEQQPPIPVTEEVSAAPSPPPVEEELPVNVAMEVEEEKVTVEEVIAPTEEEKAPAETEDAPQTVLNLKQFIPSKQKGGRGHSFHQTQEVDANSASAATQITIPSSTTQSTNSTSNVIGTRLLAKAKLAKKLSQKPISLQQLKQQARAKLIEKTMHQGKGGKKQKRKAPPPKPQTSEAEASTNSSEEAEENVEKIVMNTGTLYLYRGENPRAEFIRQTRKEKTSIHDQLSSIQKGAARFKIQELDITVYEELLQHPRAIAPTFTAILSTMPPRRSVRAKGPAYKKGDYIEYDYKGNLVTGKLNKKSLNGTEANPIWIVTPMDRRRRDEEIHEKLLGKVISAIEAMNNRGPKLGSKDGEKEAGSVVNNSSNDGSGGEEPSTSANIKNRRSGRLTPDSDDSKEIPKATSRSTRKRGSRSDDSNNNSGSDGAAHSQKSVKFSQEFNDRSADKKQNVAKAKKTDNKGTSGEALAGLLPDVMPRKKAAPKKNVKKNEHVVVVKMLTGTLYLHRGDRRRAEFIRFK
ncbi:hypothetical protein QTG54_013918 [Skeletonema marinoi]|uniref:Uncharacterized protein n=1 Tax=Skeletonema marinoi TaxID=267567 RepID=A0AAD8XX94_9STRA|nr:hypothetical protein QTG54_013918 [Skeletonema marinoi]